MDENATEGISPSPVITAAAEATLPSRFGAFRVFAFHVDQDPHEYGVVVRGTLDGQSGVPVRLHSECFTGDIMGSLRCDCRDQLEAALEYIGHAESGAVIYLRQEGRGIGLLNKIRAYALQDDGMDTVEANHALGFDDDLRSYEVAAAILRHLGVHSVRLLSNNPRKRRGLEENGVRVSELVPLRMSPNPHNHAYLMTKKNKSGHLL